MSHLLIVAYIRQSRRAAVEQALRGSQVGGWTESAVSGFGRAAGGHEVKHLRIEVLVPDAMEAAVCEAISEAASTGTPGDGLLLSLPVRSVHRLGAEDEG